MNTNNDKYHPHTHPKSRMQFNSEELQYATRSFQKTKPKMVQLVITYSGGYIKNEKQAIYVLLVFVIGSILVMYFFLFSNGADSAEIKAPPGQKLIYPEDAPPRLQM